LYTTHEKQSLVAAAASDQIELMHV